ncbi:MAG: SDR family NAD(P)-dependent oxidoreductase [Solirubrobacteraceae bacterium]
MRIDLDAPIGAEWMSGRKALVTGGGGRETGPGTVGWAISRLLARHGAAVAVLDRDPAPAHRTVSQIISAGGTAVPVIADVGAIVNITSVAARRAGTMYGLAKAALESLTGGAAYLLGERGIRINAVELGALWTAAVADNLPEEAREPRRKMSALQTEGDCFDAASAVLFLASDQARWISGQVLSVDGGGPPRMPYPGVTREPVKIGAHP